MLKRRIVGYAQWPSEYEGDGKHSRWGNLTGVLGYQRQRDRWNTRGLEIVCKPAYSERTQGSDWNQYEAVDLVAAQRSRELTRRLLEAFRRQGAHE